MHLQRPGACENEKIVRTVLYEGSHPHKLYFEAPIHGHGCLFKTSLLTHALPFPPGVYYDWWLGVVASPVGRVGCVPRLLTHSRIHPQNSFRYPVRIAQKKERLQKLRQQRIQFVETFLQRPFVRADVRRFSEDCLRLLRPKTGSGFSLPCSCFSGNTATSRFTTNASGRPSRC